MEKGIPLGLLTRELFDSEEDAQDVIDQQTEYCFDPRYEHVELKIEKYWHHQCSGCGKDLLPEDRPRTVHSCVMNYRGTVLIGDDPDKIYCQECGDKLQPVEPEQALSPVRMVHGKVFLECEAMPCYTPNKLHGYCVMDGCDKIHNTIMRFGPIVGMQIVTEAVRRYEPEYDMESLLEMMTKRITGTI
jgi:hypothetical protein